MTGRTKSNGRFQLLIFDWDGTLLDSIGSIVDCTQATLRELGMKLASEETIRSGIGLGLRETVERFAPGCDERLFGRIVEVYRRLWFDTYSLRPKLFPGVCQTLEGLHGEGYLLAVATAKSRRGLNRDLGKTGLAERFDATRTVDEAASKPHPQMILDIVEELGARASRTLMIGDTTHDLEMAWNAGADAVAVCSGSHDRPGLEGAQPLACLESIAELPEWLACLKRENGDSLRRG